MESPESPEVSAVVRHGTSAPVFDAERARVTQRDRYGWTVRSPIMPAA